MAQALLKFDLSDPEEKLEHLRAVKALDCLLALWDLSQYFRNQLKYRDNSGITGEQAIEAAREEFNDILDKYNISLDVLLH